MKRKAIGNVAAGLLFLVTAVWDFSHDTGVGAVFLIFGAVFLGIGFSERRTA